MLTNAVKYSHNHYFAYFCEHTHFSLIAYIIFQEIAKSCSFFDRTHYCLTTLFDILILYLYLYII